MITPTLLRVGKLTMETGECLTRATIWAALVLYTAGEAAASRAHQGAGKFGRVLNSLGCALFMTHVACAFHFYHHWRHSVAYADTARQTAALTGWNSGSGLYVNYAFALVWLADVICAWKGFLLDPAQPRKPAIIWVVHGFFLFMIFNGGFVFVRGPLRWLGLALCLTLIACWWAKSRRERTELLVP